MAFVHCTKFSPRRGDSTPLSLEPRLADVTQRMRRTDVESGTHGKILWGNMPAKEGMQTQPSVWVTSHKADYPVRTGEAADHQPQLVKARAVLMRTESVKLGDATAPMEGKIRMQALDRENYVARLLRRKGGSHSKTQSELYVCPSEVREWREKHLIAMSHRQFTPAAAPGGAARSADHRRAIRREMLASHFSVGGGGGSRSGGGGSSSESRWQSQSRADYKATADSSGSGGANAATRPPLNTVQQTTASSLTLADPNWKGSHVTTHSHDYPNRGGKDEVSAGCAAAAASSATAAAAAAAAATPTADASQQPRRPATAAAPLHSSLTPHAPTGAAGAAVPHRNINHSKHSWRLGYDDKPGLRYVTQQRLSFTPINFNPVTADEAARSHRVQGIQKRRESLQDMVHRSSIPL